MNQNNLMTAAFLGVFGTVCFIGGFFTGEYATYEKEIVSELMNENNLNVARGQEILRFDQDISQLELLHRLQNNSNTEEYIKTKTKSIASDLKLWEKKLEKDEYQIHWLLLELSIEKAKKITENEENS